MQFSKKNHFNYKFLINHINLYILTISLSSVAFIAFNSIKIGCFHDECALCWLIMRIWVCLFPCLSSSCFAFLCRANVSILKSRPTIDVKNCFVYAFELCRKRDTLKEREKWHDQTTEMMYLNTGHIRVNVYDRTSECVVCVFWGFNNTSPIHCFRNCSVFFSFFSYTLSVSLFQIHFVFIFENVSFSVIFI